LLVSKLIYLEIKLLIIEFVLKPELKDLSVRLKFLYGTDGFSRRKKTQPTDGFSRRKKTQPTTGFSRRKKTQPTDGFSRQKKPVSLWLSKYSKP